MHSDLMVVAETDTPPVSDANGLNPTARASKPSDGVLENPPHDDRRDNAEYEPEMCPVLAEEREDVGDPRQLACDGELRGLRDRALGLEWTCDDPRHEVAADIGEHHRRDDLVSADLRLHQRRNERPRGPCQHRGQQDQGHRHGPWVAGDHDAHECGRHTTQEELALGADVEKPGSEAVRDGKTREYQRRRPQQRLANLPDTAKRAVEHARHRPRSGCGPKQGSRPNRPATR